MRKMMMGWTLTTLVAAVLAVPSDVKSQSVRVIGMAEELESEASKLHNQRDQWEHAVDLYLAAVQIRGDEDPRAQEDLLIVASLSYETGNHKGAIAALESVASQVLAGGDVVRAAGIFTDAAWVARKARRKYDELRLSLKAAELANSSEISRAERNQILSRFLV